MFNFLIIAYILSVVIVGPLIAYDIYKNWKSGKDIHLSHLAVAVIATICPMFNTLMILYFIPKIPDMVVFHGNNEQ
jgi:hypothetical protein